MIQFCFKIVSFDLFLIFRTEKYINICLLAFPEVVVGMSQAKFLGRKKIIESASDFDDITIAQANRNQSKKKILIHYKSQGFGELPHLHYLAIVELSWIVNAECDISILQIRRHCIESAYLIRTSCTIRILDRCDRNEF